MFAHPRRRTVAALAATAVGAAALVSGVVASSADSPSATAADLAPVCQTAAAKHATIVLIHGAFAETSAWNDEVSALTAAGCSARAYANPLRDLTTDSRSVADFVRTLPGPVVLVGHSYGGSIITNAAAEVSNVVGLVFVDAAAPAPGERTSALSGSDSALNAPPKTLFDTVPYAGGPKNAVDMYLKEDVFVRDFANDLPAAQAKLLWATQRPASSAALNGKSRYAAWRTIPSWYFISTGDKIITPSAEEAMAARAHSKVTLFPGGSHLSLISHPDAVTAVIGQALAGTVGG